MNLNLNDFEVVEAVQVPRGSDELVRARVIEQIVRDFEDAGSEENYIVHVRKKRTQSESTGAQSAGAVANASSAVDPLYEKNGKLNIPYVEQNARILFDAKEFALAKNLYKAILSTGESRSRALLGLGMCLRAEGKLKEAQISLEESIAYESTLTAYRELVGVLADQGQDRAVISAIDRAIRLPGLDRKIKSELIRTKANRYCALNEWDAAGAEYYTAAESDPASEEAWIGLGTVQLKQNHPSDAQRSYQRALSIQPKSVDAWIGLGKSIAEQGGKESAQEAFVEALKIDLMNPVAIFQLVKCAYETRRFELADKWLTAYVESAPVNINLLYSLAGVKYHLNQMQEAGRLLHRILDLKSDHAGARKLLSRVTQTA